MSKLKKCKTCGADIASNAKSCPSCGAKNKKPLYTRWWFLLIVVCVIIAAFSSQGGSGESSVASTTTNTDGSTTTNTDDSTSAEKPEETKKPDFEVVGDITNESDEFATYLSGIIRNNKSKDCSYVQVTFNLYDAEGNLIGTAIDNVNNLEAGGTWKFKAMGMGESGEPASYKLAEITGF